MMVKVSAYNRATTNYDFLCEIDFVPHKGDTIEYGGKLYEVYSVVHRWFPKETIVTVDENPSFDYDTFYGRHGL